MSVLIDILGAFILGGIFMTSFLNLNHTMTDTNWETTLDLVTQENSVAVGQILENDIYKIGTGDTSKVMVTRADSNRIHFRSDVDFNGTIDSVQYYTGTTAELKSTTNPRDMILYRVVNNKTTVMNVGCVNFKLSYYDSAGTVTGTLNKINAVKVVLDLESRDPNMNNKYGGVHWEQFIVPKSLHY
jgi:hypothetical protein